MYIQVRTNVIFGKSYIKLKMYKRFRSQDIWTLQGILINEILILLFVVIFGLIEVSAPS
jgi:hypothetical protein